MKSVQEPIPLGRPGGPRSAIDHILVNDIMVTKFIGLDIDENAEQCNISDNLLRAWFRIGREESDNWIKKKYETRTYYKTDKESLIEMEKDLVSRIRGPVSFNAIMDKIEIAQDRTLKQEIIIKMEKNNNKYIVSVAWVDKEVKMNMKLKQILNKKWK